MCLGALVAATHSIFEESSSTRRLGPASGYGIGPLLPEMVDKYLCILCFESCVDDEPCMHIVEAFGDQGPNGDGRCLLSRVSRQEEGPDDHEHGSSSKL